MKCCVRVSGEYNMMSQLKYRLIGASSSLVVALALLAFSLVLGTSRSYAHDVEAISCPPPALDIVAELAEELDVASILSSLRLLHPLSKARLLWLKSPNP